MLPFTARPLCERSRWEDRQTDANVDRYVVSVSVLGILLWMHNDGNKFLVLLDKDAAERFLSFLIFFHLDTHSGVKPNLESTVGLLVDMTCMFLL